MLSLILASLILGISPLATGNIAYDATAPWQTVSLTLVLY